MVSKNTICLWYNGAALDAARNPPNELLCLTTQQASTSCKFQLRDAEGVDIFNEASCALLRDSRTRCMLRS
ncbi:MAG: hypothetical protein ABI870_16245 [Rhodanobacter sp.]